MYELKVRAVGSSSGLVLPKELLAELGVSQGDRLFATKGADGAFRLTPYDDVFSEQAAAGEQVLREYRDVFKALAKR
jgi:putative addiction module antidote